MLNYHEMTMNEPRDSPQRRKQFLVICVIMTITTLHSALSAGILSSMSIIVDTFPSNANGGEFVYKLMNKDYAASTGTIRTISSDLNIVEDGTQSNLIIAEDTEGKVVTDTADLLYSIYLDDASLVPGGQTRFVSGVLLSSKVLGTNGSSGKEMKKQLLDVNSKILADDDKKKKKKKSETSLHSKDVLYEIGNLPKVNAAVMTHPFTAGAMSAILQSYKIVPKFKAYAKENNVSGNFIIISTCSAKQSMCTYYMPLSKQDKFYLGHPTTAEYATQFENIGTLERWGIEFLKDGLSIGGIHFGKVWLGIKRLVFGGGKTSTGDEL